MADDRTFVWVVGCNLNDRGLLYDLLSLDFQSPQFQVSFPDTVSSNDVDIIATVGPSGST